MCGKKCDTECITINVTKCITEYYCPVNTMCACMWTRMWRVCVCDVICASLESVCRVCNLQNKFVLYLTLV